MISFVGGGEAHKQTSPRAWQRFAIPRTFNPNKLNRHQASVRRRPRQRTAAFVHTGLPGWSAGFPALQCYDPRRGRLAHRAITRIKAQSWEDGESGTRRPTADRSIARPSGLARLWCGPSQYHGLPRRGHTRVSVARSELPKNHFTCAPEIRRSCL